jgi:hypothetical protein
MLFSLMKMTLYVLPSSVTHAALRVLVRLRTKRTVGYSTFTVTSSVQAVCLSVCQIMIRIPTLFFFFLGKMESNTKTLNKESLKRADRPSNNRKKETTEQANNWKRKISEKMAEKRKMESSELGNNQKRKIAEKMAEKRKMESSEQGNNQKSKIAEKMAENRKMENSEQGNNRKRKNAEKNGRKGKIGDTSTASKKD